MRVWKRKDLYKENLTEPPMKKITEEENIEFLRALRDEAMRPKEKNKIKERV